MDLDTDAHVKANSRPATRVIAHVTCLPTEQLGESYSLHWPFYPAAELLSYY